MSLFKSDFCTTPPIAALVAAHLKKTADRCVRKSGAPHRTGAPVLRRSLLAGTFEDTFFSVPAKGETDKLLTKARRMLDAANRLRRQERAGKKLTSRERKVAQLHEKAVRVYEELLTLARLNKGQVYPSYDWLAQATALGRRTVVRAVAVLEDLGLLQRQRRFTRDETSQEGAPRYRQTSNAYRATFNEALASFLPRWLRPAPIPEDAIQREADRLDETDHMLSQLTCRELARATVSGPLGSALAALGSRIDTLGASATVAHNR